MVRVSFLVVVAVCIVSAAWAQEPRPRTRPREVPPATRPRNPETPPETRKEPAEPSARAPASPAPTPMAGPQIGADAVPVVVADAGSRQHKRIVCRLKSVPATDAAAALAQFLRAEAQTAKSAGTPSVSIVAEPIGNLLLIGGLPEAVEEVRRLVEELDRPPAMVALEVLLAEAPIEGGKDAKPAGPGGELRLLQKPAQMNVVARIRLVTLDNQKASVQVGRQEASITGTISTQFGQTNSVSYNRVGTMINVMPRVTPDGQVTLDLDVSHSHQGSAEDGVPISVTKDGKTIRAPNTETLTAKATVTLGNGQTAVLGGHAERPNANKELLLVVTPDLLRADGGEMAKKSGTTRKRSGGEETRP